jgi:hypothetical protein
MNKSILVAGALIAGAILLQPVVARLVEKQTTICTKTRMRQVISERDARQENPLHKGFGAEPPRGKNKLYDLNAPNESDRPSQD